MMKVLTIKAISFKSEKQLIHKMAVVKDPELVELRKLIEEKMKEVCPTLQSFSAVRDIKSVTTTSRADAVELLDLPVSLLLQNIETPPPPEICVTIDVLEEAIEPEIYGGDGGKIADTSGVREIDVGKFIHEDLERERGVIDSRPHPGALSNHFDKHGRVLEGEELAQHLRRKGLCQKCGEKTHKVALRGGWRTPLTIPDQVSKGRCLRCSPTAEINSDLNVPRRRRLTALMNQLSRPLRWRCGGCTSSEGTTVGRDGYGVRLCEVTTGTDNLYTVPCPRPVAPRPPVAPCPRPPPIPYGGGGAISDSESIRSLESSGSIGSSGKSAPVSHSHEVVVDEALMIAAKSSSILPMDGGAIKSKKAIVEDDDCLDNVILEEVKDEEAPPKNFIVDSLDRLTLRLMIKKRLEEEDLSPLLSDEKGTIKAVTVDGVDAFDLLDLPLSLWLSPTDFTNFPKVGFSIGKEGETNDQLVMFEDQQM